MTARTNIICNALGARIFGKFANLILALAARLPGGRAILETRDTQVPVTFQRWFSQKVLGINGAAYWPMHPSSTATYVHRIRIGIETSPGWAPGCLIQGMNGIEIGDYTQISQNVAIISADHNPYSLPDHLPCRSIRIGRYCLLGFNSVILPGVVLGDYTIVGANAVVSSSFEEGHAVLGGVPARVLKRLDPSQDKNYRSQHEYHGYISAPKFAAFERRYLLVATAADGHSTHDTPCS